MLYCVRRLVELLLAGQPLPKHVAFIMDGNRRFADQLNVERIDGHKSGYNKMKDIIQWCLGIGITYISVYAFSIDNFKRPQDEVDSLMELARIKFEELLHDEDAKQWGAELRVIGDLSKAPPAIQRAAARLMQGSRENGPARGVVNICFSYTSTEELQHSISQACRGVTNEQLQSNDINPELLTQLMHTRECPPVDLLIRTSGEQRLSDFLLWQSSCALLHWEPCLWPEFGYVQLLQALLAWQKAAPRLQELQQQQYQQQQQQEEECCQVQQQQQHGCCQAQQQQQHSLSSCQQQQQQQRMQRFVQQMDSSYQQSITTLAAGC